MDLVKEQYKNADQLNIRIALHDKYSTNRLGLRNWLLANFEIPDNSKVLEVGCGTGVLWKGHLGLFEHGSKLLLTDFSQGMVDEARQNLGELKNLEYQQMDIQAIPFEVGTFDVIIANSMLYHIPDKERALSEVARVLKKDGVFYCSTYGEHGLLGYIADSLKEFGVEDRVNNSFTLQNGLALLQRYFSKVTRIDYEDSLAITNVEDLIAYIRSCTSMTNVTEIPYDVLKEHLESQMVNGVITIPKEHGMFICRS